ncbi:MAG TPA: FtsW/RodA/SpoVE family cell cycle protein, partial [Bryobacteraceae bacterium]|nr:FtsW/RodA/SpoVE family cell cycle protein [Bryobacteraceae bacterium]
MARRIFDHVQQTSGTLPNVGAIGRIRVGAREVASGGNLPGLQARLPQARSLDNTIPLLTQSQVARLKSELSVRTYGAYMRSFWSWLLAYFAVFYLLHAVWSFRYFDGDQTILPALHALTGTGLILILTLRDPLRDTLSFVDFAQSVCIAAVLMGGLVWVNFERLFAGLSYIPLLGAVALSLILVLFGTGPGTSDAKVNLLGFQPVELIKILLVLFLAGYFARRWEFLRVLRERRPELEKISRYVEIPRLEYLLPVFLAMALTLTFFFLQKDLGPALIISCVFLGMYSVARGQVLLAVAGLAMMLGGFLLGYFLEYPRTVHDRVSMWLSPWDNMVRGGEQVVHSLWAFATGGPFGTGIGLGDPDIMPAAHTDLILAVLGEEWGFLGLAIVYLLYAALVWTGLRIALQSATDYAFFLSLGLTLLIGLNILLISGGVLDLTPLSGVVTPFLSYGGTAMIANFIVFAVLLALSRTKGDSDQTRPFRKPTRRLAQVLACALLVVVGKAAWIQLVRADPVVGAGTLTVQGDGFRRYQYNPRLMAIAASIPRGTIYDRNGLALATSNLTEIDKNKPAYARLGINSDANVRREDARHYPLGAVAVHLLGDLRSRANWGARNSSLIERDSMVRLQGYNDRASVMEVPDPRTGKAAFTIRHDYQELVPLLRHKQQPDHPEVRKVLNRERDVRTTIDSRLQVRAARILQARLQKLGRKKGSVVVMDPETGDLLASVSYPWPSQMPPALGPDDSADELLDRARYGLYPPGSTFKIVTAIAALRKDPASATAVYECR